eukprot:TRINITY_DN45278_c0_g2_i1.p1 TRINITY_DN45278_c0_g2~~TRINITY_DN45278_c0_g2_i1.p1  ORF type:complete len:142 (+),score=8.91 TRINITY_DN45278_c0_g2_i1:79-504(+)
MSNILQLNGTGLIQKQQQQSQINLKNYQQLEEKNSKEKEKEKCSFCGQIYPKLRCSKCKTVKYCNANCQKNHWQKHKLNCCEKSIKNQGNPTIQNQQQQLIGKNISNELLFEVFRRLNPTDLLRCFQVSKNWNKIACIMKV